MARKTLKLELPISSGLCFDTLYEIGGSYLGWELVNADKNTGCLKWKEKQIGLLGGTFIVLVTATWTSTDDRETNLTLSAKFFPVGVFDPTDELGKSLQRLIVPLLDRIDALAEMKKEFQRGIKEGHICPKCGRQFQTVVGFCPIDGTPIGRVCSNCENIEPPNAHFCSKCGTKF